MATLRALGGSASMRCPARWIDPLVAASRPAVNRSSVDLPHPEGPSTTTSSPSPASNEKSSSAHTSPQRLVSPRKTTAATSAPASREHAAAEEGLEDEIGRAHV